MRYSTCVLSRDQGSSGGVQRHPQEARNRRSAEQNNRRVTEENRLWMPSGVLACAALPSTRLVISGTRGSSYAVLWTRGCPIGGEIVWIW